MAYIEPRKNKKGEITSYRIIVSDGMDLDGKQIRRIMTWTPTPGMSQHQIEKELNAAAVKFEEQIEYGYQLDSQQTLAEYIEYVLDLKERAGIAPRTLDRYRSLRTRILKALGHMKLSQIRPQHLNSFYKDLAQPGVRDSPDKAIAKKNLEAEIRRQYRSKASFSQTVSLSASTVNRAIRREPITLDTAQKIANGLHQNWKRLFSPAKDCEPLSDKTILEYHGFLSTVFAQAEKELLIPYNPAAKDEYYMMENRKREGFDQKLPAAGLMVYHVDYDPTVWAYNCPNAYLTGVNDHERMTFIPADGLRTSDTETGDTWPYGNTSTLTSAQATCFNANTDGSKLMNISLSNIALSDNGLASFTFTNYNNSGTAEGFAFKETFDKCSGKGGNGSEGFMCGNTLALRSWGASFTPDNGKNTDWDGYATAYGANQCLRAGGSSDSKVTVTTPQFTLNGTATLTFKASPFGLANKYDGTALTVSANGDGASLSQTSFTMTAGEWTTFTAKLTAHGTVSLTFAPAGRFYLDEIAVPDPASTGIEAVTSAATRSGNIYRLDGTYAGTQSTGLPAGIYIRGGKKFVVK